MSLGLSISLLIAAAVANSLLVGTTLDQSIKQLPARRRIGVLAFSAYSQAADLSNGVPWYAALGIGSALLTFAAALTALSAQVPASQMAALSVAAGLTLAHSATTAVAAPLNFSQRKAGNDEQALARVFDRFERAQTLRAGFQTATLGALVWALVVAVAPLSLSLALLMATAVVAGVGAGATLDQTVKQLPARHRIGALAYSAYSQAADGANGRFWYIPLAAIWLVLILASAITGWSSHPSTAYAIALGIMVAGLAAHGFVTGRFAIPLLLSQDKYAGDEPALRQLFDRFARWNLIRACIDTGVLAATVSALIVTMGAR